VSLLVAMPLPAAAATATALRSSGASRSAGRPAAANAARTRGGALPAVAPAGTLDPATDPAASGYVHSHRQTSVGEAELALLAAAGDEAQGLACSEERPFAVDVGAGLGDFAVLAARLGCQVRAGPALCAARGPRRAPYHRGTLRR